MAIIKQLVLAATAAILALSATVTMGHAGWQDASLSLSCSNGRSYALTPRAVAYDGDVVTGYLHLSPRRSVHVRLVPMGVGYRYAGLGIWLDGVRGEAVLHFGKHRAVDCSVSPALPPYQGTPYVVYW